MKYYIITGTSRGLGESLAKHLIQPGHTLFCLSRSGNPALQSMAAERQAFVHDIQFDLQHVQEIPDLMTRIMKDIDFRDAESLFLINNAGVLAPVVPAGKYSPEELQASIQINLLTPMLLSSECIARSSESPIEKRIINITSGAAQHPYSGWGAYCSTKAGLDMFTRCVGEEQEGQQTPVLMIAVTPGVVDTDMQSQLRQTKEENFPDVDRFIVLHQEGKLLAPDEAAKKIITLIHRDDLLNGRIYDIRNK